MGSHWGNACLFCVLRLCSQPMIKIPFSDVPSKYRPKDVPDPAGIPIDQLDIFHLMIMTDETSRVEGGVMNSLAGASVIGIPPVYHHGTEEQKQKWLPGL